MGDDLFQDGRQFLALQDYERHEKEGGQLLLISRLDSKWIRTNAMGAVILERLGEPGTFRALAAALATEYDLPESLIRESIEPFLQGALKTGFIQPYDPERGEGVTSTFVPVQEWVDALSLQTIWIHVTNACQLRCGYCSVASAPDLDRSKDLTLDEIASIYEGLPEGPVYKTVISGGEPFLREDIVEIAKECKKHGYTYLTTNGIVEDKQRLIDALPYLDEFQISVDGPDSTVHDRIRGEGSFARIETTLAWLKEQKYDNLWISTTAINDNVESLTKMLRFAYGHGARGFYVGRLIPSGRSRDNSAIFPTEEQLEGELKRLWWAYGTLVDYNKKNREFKFELTVARDKLGRAFSGQRFHNCTLGGCGTISIAHNGDVYPCSLLHLEAMKIGSVREEPFREILKLGQALYSRYTVDTLPHCKDCTVRYICGGGCLALPYYADGDLGSRNPECKYNLDNVVDWCWEIGPVFYRPRYTRNDLFKPEPEESTDREEEPAKATEP